MQTVMHALCRHVPKSGLQTDTNFLRVGTCSYFLHKKRSACDLLWNVWVRRHKKWICWQAVIRLFGSEKSISPLRTSIHRDRVRFFLSGLTAGERKYFGQAFVAVNLSILHQNATSICCMEHSNLVRTQRHEFADWYANMAVEHNLDREIGLMSTMMVVLAHWDNQN